MKFRKTKERKEEEEEQSYGNNNNDGRSNDNLPSSFGGSNNNCSMEGLTLSLDLSSKPTTATTTGSTELTLGSRDEKGCHRGGRRHDDDLDDETFLTMHSNTSTKRGGSSSSNNLDFSSKTNLLSLMVEYGGLAFTKSKKDATLCGREQELALLKDLFHRITSPEINTHTDTHNHATDTQSNQSQQHTADQHNIRQPLQPKLSLRRRLSQDQQQQSQCVLISGPSGSGKSVLCESIVDHVVSHDGFFVRGKHDQFQSGIPYSALVAAFTEICDLMRQSPHLATFQSRIVDQYFSHQDDLKEISLLISNLNQVTGKSFFQPLSQQQQQGGKQQSTTRSSSSWSLQSTNDDDEREGTPTIAKTQDSFTRFKILCQTFLQAVATPKHPIVLLLDDLQFADTASLQVIRALMTDLESKHVLILGIYRQQETYTSEFTKFIESFEESSTTGPTSPPSKAPATSLPLHRIQIGNLSQANVNKAISRILSCPAAETEELSQVVYTKTSGLPLAVTEFLQLLVVESMLYHDKDGSKQWDWDLDRIKSETNVSGNVAAILTERLFRIDGNVREALIVAACFGHSFRFDLLQAVLRDEWKSRARNSILAAMDFADSVRFILEKSTKLGLIEKMSENLFKFSHDTIQSALFEFAKKDRDLPQLHCQIGRKVHQFLNACTNRQQQEQAHASNDYESPQSDFLVFAATDQLNRGSSKLTEEEEILSLIRLNMVASKKATLKNGFGKALVYLRNAVTLWERQSEVTDLWASHYDLSLQVFLEVAEREGQSGNISVCRESFDVIHKHAHSFLDKVRVYKTLIACLAAQKQLQESIELGLEVLKEMGVCFPSNASKFHILRSLAWSAVMVGRKTDEQLCNLPRMKDENLLAVMPILPATSINALLAGNAPLYSLMSLRVLQLTLKHGLCPESVVGFQTWSMMNALLGRRDEAYRFGKLALRLADKLGAEKWKSRIMMQFYVYINHWKHPLQSSIDPLFDGYHIGMQHGDMFYAFMCASTGTWAINCSGRPLSQVEDFFRILCPKMLEFGQETVYLLGVILWQAVQNMQGQCVDPLILDGDAMDQDYVVTAAMQSRNYMALYMRQLTLLGLAGFYQDWDLAVISLNKMKAPEYETIRKYMQLHYNVDFWSFFSGMAYIRTGQFSKARKIRRQMQQWVKGGKLDAQATLQILNVELLFARYDRNNGKAKADAPLVPILKGFDLAITSAKEQELWHCVAYANERAGYILCRMGLIESAGGYFTAAEEAYMKWEAFGKVEHLTESMEQMVVGRCPI